MIVLAIVIVAIIGAIFALRGEGSTYGKGNNIRDEKRRVNVSDKNFFL